MSDIKLSTYFKNKKDAKTDTTYSKADIESITNTITAYSKIIDENLETLPKRLNNEISAISIGIKRNALMQNIYGFKTYQTPAYPDFYKAELKAYSYLCVVYAQAINTPSMSSFTLSNDLSNYSGYVAYNKKSNLSVATIQSSNYKSYILIRSSDVVSWLTKIMTILSNIRKLRYTIYYKSTLIMGGIEISLSANDYNSYLCGDSINIKRNVKINDKIEEITKSEKTWTLPFLIGPFARKNDVQLSANEKIPDYRTFKKRSRSLDYLSSTTYDAVPDNNTITDLIYTTDVASELPTFDISNNDGSNGVFTLYRTVDYDTYDLVEHIDLIKLFGISQDKPIRLERVKQAIIYIFEQWQKNLKIINYNYYVCHYNCHSESINQPLGPLDAPGMTPEFIFDYSVFEVNEITYTPRSDQKTSFVVDYFDNQPLSLSDTMYIQDVVIRYPYVNGNTGYLQSFVLSVYISGLTQETQEMSITSYAVSPSAYIKKTGSSEDYRFVKDNQDKTNYPTYYNFANAYRVYDDTVSFLTAYPLSVPRGYQHNIVCCVVRYEIAECTKNVIQYQRKKNATQYVSMTNTKMDIKDPKSKIITPYSYTALSTELCGDVSLHTIEFWKYNKNAQKFDKVEDPIANPIFAVPDGLSFNGQWECDNPDVSTEYEVTDPETEETSCLPYIMQFAVPRGLTGKIKMKALYYDVKNIVYKCKHVATATEAKTVWKHSKPKTYVAGLSAEQIYEISNELKYITDLDKKGISFRGWTAADAFISVLPVPDEYHRYREDKSDTMQSVIIPAYTNVAQDLVLVADYDITKKITYYKRTKYSSPTSFEKVKETGLNVTEYVTGLSTNLCALSAYRDTDPERLEFKQWTCDIDGVNLSEPTGTVGTNFKQELEILSDVTCDITIKADYYKADLITYQYKPSLKGNYKVIKSGITPKQYKTDYKDAQEYDIIFDDDTAYKTLTNVTDLSFAGWSEAHPNVDIFGTYSPTKKRGQTLSVGQNTTGDIIVTAIQYPVHKITYMYKNSIDSDYIKWKDTSTSKASPSQFVTLDYVQAYKIDVQLPEVLSMPLSTWSCENPNVTCTYNDDKTTTLSIGANLDQDITCTAVYDADKYKVTWTKDSSLPYTISIMMDNNIYRNTLIWSKSRGQDIQPGQRVDSISSVPDAVFEVNDKEIKLTEWKYKTAKNSIKTIKPGGTNKSLVVDRDEVTLTAVFKDYKMLTVTFQPTTIGKWSDESTKPKELECVKGTIFSPDLAPADIISKDTAKVFSHWAKSGSTKDYSGTAITKNVGVNAQFAKAPQEMYNICYYGNGGLPDKQVKVVAAGTTFVNPDQMPSPPDIKKQFNHWNTASDQTGNIYYVGNRLTGDLSVYAIWW